MENTQQDNMNTEQTSQPPQAPIEPIVPHANKISRFVIRLIVLIVVYVVIALIAGLWPFAQSDITEDWMTYRNEEYGFEFKHPENIRTEWFEEDLGDGEQSNRGINFIKEGIESINLNINDTIYVGGAPTEIISDQSTTLGSLAVREVESYHHQGGGPLGWKIIYYFEHNNDKFSLRIITYDASSENNISTETKLLVEQILSTFDFVN